MNNDITFKALKEKMDEGYILLDTKIDFDKSGEKEGMLKINMDFYFAKPEEIKVYGKENG